MNVGARAVLAAAVSVLVAACSGSSGSAAGPRVDLLATGGPSDAFAAFEVGIDGITLVTVDGERVPAFGRVGPVDLVAPEPFAEVLGSGRIPAARYRRAIVTLDFTAARVRLAGAPDTVAIHDATDRRLSGPVEIGVDFPADARPQARAAAAHRLSLAIDLDEAVEVVGDGVRFRPALELGFDAEPSATWCTRGTLEAVDPDAGSFVVRRSGDARAVRIDTGTAFQIDGDGYLGDAGLRALAMLPAPTAVSVRGTGDGEFLVATIVEAGRGGPAPGQDRVEGWIVGRNAGRGVDAGLVVYGSLVPWDGAPTHATTTFVQVAYAGTRVLRDRGHELLNSDALQVGQRIVAFGAFDGSTGRLDAGPAQRGIVRMLPTSVRGIAPREFASDPVIELTLTNIGHVAIERFDFAVEETPTIDPMQYRVDVATAAPGTIAAGAQLEVIGQVNVIGSAGGVEFVADSVHDRRTTAVWDIAWPERGPLADPLVDRGGIVVPLDDTRRARTHDGFGGRTLGTGPIPSIVPAAERGSWVVVRGTESVLHRDFTDFAVHLSAWLTGGEHPLALRAVGADDATAERLVARSITVVLR